MYRVVYFSGFVKTDLSVPERKLGESHGSPKILFMTIECSQSAHSIVTIKLRLRFIKTSTLPNFLFACHTILAVELIDTSASLCCLLLASVERMALRTNFNVKFGLGRAGYECVATVTGYSCLVVVRMDSCFHFLSPRLILIGYLYLFSSARPFGHCL